MFVGMALTAGYSIGDKYRTRLEVNGSEEQSSFLLSGINYEHKKFYDEGPGFFEMFFGGNLSTK